MIIALWISLVWLAALMALVLRLATRAEQPPPCRERSPRLLPDTHAAFEEIVCAAFRSKTAAAEHVWDRAQKDLYVRP